MTTGEGRIKGFACVGRRGPVVERAVPARPGRVDAVLADPGFGIVPVSGAVGLAGGSAAFASRGFDKAVDFAVAAFDVGP
jgi:hypothetical protein